MRSSFRNLSSRLPFLVAALATLALSIGAATAIFTVVNAYLLSSLPYDDPSRLVMLWRSHEAPSGEEIEDELPLSPGDFTDLRRGAQSFEGVAGLVSEMVTVTGSGEPARIHVMLTAGDFFSVLRLRAARGRVLGPADERADAPAAVVVSHDYWQRNLGGDPAVLGREIRLGGGGHQIVGVLPPEFRLIDSLAPAHPRFSRPVDVWAPLALGERAHERGFRGLYALARLRPGAGLAAAQDEANAYAREMARLHPETDAGYGLRVVPLQDQIFGPLRPVLLALWAATGFVLLIACANLATLLLARGQSRQRDFAVRLALGASRPKIVGQSLRESLWLAVGGGILALFVGAAGARLLAILNPVPVFRSFPPEPDLRVAIFTLAVAIVAGLLFGAVPAVRASRAELAADPGGRGGRLDRRARLTLGTLVVVQIALATTLLVAAGLSARSYARLLHADLGVDTQGIATLDLFLPLSRYRETPRKVELFRRLLDDVAALPGVESVGMSYALPFSGVDPSNGFAIEGRSQSDDELWSANLGLVNADYFATLGIPLVRGRLFRDSDDQDASPVALIDEHMVEQYFAGADPLGRRISIASDQMATIVGVVGAVRHEALEEVPRPYVYLPYQQRSYMYTSLAIATSRERPLSVVPEVRRLLANLDPELPISNVSTLDSAYRRAIAPQRFSLLLIGIVTGVAFFLTLVGTYGVMSVLARERRQEVGIRMALGATPREASLLLLRQGLLLSAIGAAFGLAIAAGLVRAMASLVYGIGAIDGTVYVVVPAAVLLATFAACYFPARSLGGVEPNGILRSP